MQDQFNQDSPNPIVLSINEALEYVIQQFRNKLIKLNGINRFLAFFTNISTNSEDENIHLLRII